MLGLRSPKVASNPCDSCDVLRGEHNGQLHRAALMWRELCGAATHIITTSTCTKVPSSLSKLCLPRPPPVHMKLQRRCDPTNGPSGSNRPLRNHDGCLGTAGYPNGNDDLSRGLFHKAGNGMLTASLPSHIVGTSTHGYWKAHDQIATSRSNDNAKNTRSHRRAEDLVTLASARFLSGIGLMCVERPSLISEAVVPYQ